MNLKVDTNGVQEHYEENVDFYAVLVPRKLSCRGLPQFLETNAGIV